ncbi:hypothetical protein MA16_Dca003151 [Dendrobium catenatum]|uniref:Uncharacterized protein n=1 Tax=Dendrobium catenatum TaxID=906689 RepID=A0A2I0XBX4_9ASPA|nr:hypothetical protein MA16_Dca003151 [Dendrobium catenatum]
MGDAFSGCRGFMNPFLSNSEPPLVPPDGLEEPKNSAKMSLLRFNRDVAGPPLVPPDGLEKPKNSAKISSLLFRFNRDVAGPSRPLKNEAPAPLDPGGGTCPFNPSSPY